MDIEETKIKGEPMNKNKKAIKYTLTINFRGSAKKTPFNFTTTQDLCNPLRNYFDLLIVDQVHLTKDIGN